MLCLVVEIVTKYLHFFRLHRLNLLNTRFTPSGRVVGGRIRSTILIPQCWQVGYHYAWWHFLFTTYSHITKTFLLESSGNICSSMKVHTWHHDANKPLSPSCTFCSHCLHFAPKTFLLLAFFFPLLDNPTYTHNNVFFSHHFTILHTTCIVLLLHLHIIDFLCVLSYFYIFTLLLHYVVILYLHTSSCFINVIGVFFLSSLCVLLLHVFSYFAI